MNPVERERKIKQLQENLQICGEIVHGNAADIFEIASALLGFFEKTAASFCNSDSRVQAIFESMKLVEARNILQELWNCYDKNVNERKDAESKISTDQPLKKRELLYDKLKECEKNTEDFKSRSATIVNSLLSALSNENFLSNKNILSMVENATARFRGDIDKYEKFKKEYESILARIRKLYICAA